MKNIEHKAIKMFLKIRDELKKQVEKNTIKCEKINIYFTLESMVNVVYNISTKKFEYLELLTDEKSKLYKIEIPEIYK